MPSSFFKSSARWGPTPFKYSMGLDNMSGNEEMLFVSYKCKCNMKDLILED
jgi:hypothetical protein